MHPFFATIDSKIYYLQDLKYPFIGKVQINGQTIDYMRDTGSTIIIVQDKYVQVNSFTGNKISVLLADRCVRSLPEAIVHLKCTCYESEVNVLVMKDPIYPLSLGIMCFKVKLLRKYHFAALQSSWKTISAALTFVDDDDDISPG